MSQPSTERAVSIPTVNDEEIARERERERLLLLRMRNEFVKILTLKRRRENVETPKNVDEAFERCATMLKLRHDALDQVKKNHAAAEETRCLTTFEKQVTERSKALEWARIAAMASRTVEEERARDEAEAKESSPKRAKSQKSPKKGKRA